MVTAQEKLDLLRRAQRIEGLRAIVNSPVLSEFVKGGFNVLTSIAQAGSTNPMMAAGGVALTAGMVKRAGLISRFDKNLVQGMATSYLGAEVLSEGVGGLIESVGSIVGGTPQAPTATTIAFDIADNAPTIPAQLSGGSPFGLPAGQVQDALFRDLLETGISAGAAAAGGAAGAAAGTAAGAAGRGAAQAGSGAAGAAAGARGPSPTTAASTVGIVPLKALFELIGAGEKGRGGSGGFVG